MSEEVEGSNRHTVRSGGVAGMTYIHPPMRIMGLFFILVRLNMPGREGAE